MSSVLERTLGLLDLLSRHAEGLELAVIAERLNMPRSGAHRLLNELIQHGYVRQRREHGDYSLTTRLVSMGLTYLSHTGIVDIAQPLLDQLAQTSGELVRLSVVDNDRLTWVARAQGTRHGLRYDPDMGSDARLSCSSSGWAWLSTLPQERVLTLLARQGLGGPDQFGPAAPTRLEEVLQRLDETRARGYSLTIDTYSPGLSAMAAPVRLPSQATLGVLSIAGPSARFTLERMQLQAQALLETAAQLAVLSGASPFFQQVQANALNAAPAGRKPIYAD